MINKELIEYIDSQRKLGKDDETIRQSLLGNNWTNEDINQALKLKNNSIVKRVKVTYISGILLLIIFLFYIFLLFFGLGTPSLDLFFNIALIAFFILLLIFICSMFFQVKESVSLIRSKNIEDKKQGTRVLGLSLFILIIILLWLFLN